MADNTGLTPQGKLRLAVDKMDRALAMSSVLFMALAHDDADCIIGDLQDTLYEIETIFRSARDLVEEGRTWF